MDWYQRMGMYFFTLGAILAILAGAFPMSATMYNFVLIILIFLGVFSAILNVGDDEEIGFIVAASAFLLTIVAFKFLLGYHPFIQGLAGFFEMITFFIGSMLAVVALRTVFEYGSQADMGSLEHADAIDSHMDTLMLSEKEKTWNFVVFFSVATSFIVILLDVFFEIVEFSQYFFAFDILITFIFAIDLVVLYKKEKTFHRFFKNCWLDIIATIPFFLIMNGLFALRVLKMARLIRIMRFAKLNKTLKFMSEKSGVKHYLHGNQLYKEKNPVSKKKATKKSK